MKIDKSCIQKNLEEREEGINQLNRHRKKLKSSFKRREKKIKGEKIKLTI